MNTYSRIAFTFLSLLLFTGCSDRQKVEVIQEPKSTYRYVTYQNPLIQDVTLLELSLTKEFVYDKYTLEDTYKYGDKERSFKWDKIKDIILMLENNQKKDRKWVVIQNYRNMNLEAPAVKNFIRNEYNKVCDTLMVEKHQSAPLYFPDDTINAIIYARDGSIAEITDSIGRFYAINMIDDSTRWLIPKRYAFELPRGTRFHNLIVVDRICQNITTLERTGRANWKIRSMNPATTGMHQPPYAQETPLGLFLLQEKKKKMHFLKDGTSKMGGYAPYASRFTCGAYIHGVPVNLPATQQIEYGWSLGTTPRSHMCVRNATSHAQYIYDSIPELATVIAVIE